MAASTPFAGSSPIDVSSDTYHDTSRPLHSYKPSNTPTTSHPAKHGPPHAEGPPAADTSGGSTPTANAPAASTNFDGTPDNSGVIPSDSNGAAGTTQFVEVVNAQIAVYSKSGGHLLGPENTNTLFSGFGGSCQNNNDGDGTVAWDTLSQRWVVQQLSVSTQPFFICVAVSTSADATGSWNRYSFQYANFPDYPKLGVWPDAYYVTVNQFNAAGTTGLGEETCALNRAAMLAGASASTQCFSLNSSGENTALPASLNGTTPPAAGTPEWLVGISPTTANALAYWRLHIDWTTPANSTLSTQTDLPVTAFSEACGGAGTCVPQSGTTQKLDSLADRLMYSLPYRNFGDHESIMVTHSITAGSSVGMRWYELRPSGSTLGVFQQGTYAPDSAYRWMGSIGIDKSGDVALGYSTSSSSLHPGVAYTGRLPSDPAGTMPQGETTLFTGAGSQIASFGNPGNRWGDYSGMSIDPSDDCTFWYVNQYVPSNGDFNWHTRVGSLKFPSCGGTAGNDFSISASPTSLTLQQNASGSSTISTAVTSGVAGAVSLAVSGTPNGATASVNPTSVTAGGSSTLSVNAGTATPGGYTLTVTGSEGTATHTATVSLTVTGTGGAVVTNGGFETGSLSSWTTGGVFSPTVTTTQVHSGSDAAQLGASAAPEPNGDSSLTQTITVPSGSSTLSFWYWPSTTDTITYDWQEAQIRDTSGNTLTSVMKVCSNAQTWTQVTFDMTPYAGQNVQLYFNAHGDGFGDLTYMYLDDVSVTQNAPASDFSIGAGAFSPASVTQGASATSTISTAVTSGSAQSVSLSASGLPTGATASFNPASVTAGASSTLTVGTSSTTPAGTYPITITGTGTSATHTTSASLTVVGNDFSISANPTSLSLAQSAAGSSTISTAVTSGSAGTVSLGVSGTPSGATATLTPNSVTAGGTSALNVNAGTASAGTYTLTVSGTEGAATHSTTVALTVVANDFSISASPSSLTLAQNAAGSSTISTAVTSGVAGTVSLSVSGTPSGATASLTSNSVTAGNSTTLNVNAGTAAPGSYTLTVTGTEGSTSHAATVSLTVTGTGPPSGLVQLSSDAFTDPNAEHATTVEPDTLSNGSTMVSVFQVGRFNNGGSDDIGFATTTNAGSTWSQGLLPGLTAAGGGSPNLNWARVSDPSVAYDPKHGAWLAASLAIDSSASGRGVAVNRSTDGVTWSPATNAVSQTADFFDKSWIACDQTSTSSHYGNCYIEFDDNSLSNSLRMLTSTDGGVTWSVARGTSDNAHGLGGQPLVQPNGNIVVPYFADSASQMRAFVSTNGGSSWNSSRLISSVTDHAAAGGLRTEPLPSAEIDSSGRVYVVWQDCRFRSGCTSNDIVMSKSSNGTSWNSVTRIPIEASTSGADHFIPGLAVDRSTSGSSAHLGLYYYYYPVASCTTCQLDVGFISSVNGGSSWNTAAQVAGPMTLDELAPTTQGPMVGDYMSASFMAGRAWSVFAVGQPPSGSTLNEAMYTLSGGLAAPGGTHQPDSVGGGGRGGGRSHSSTAF